jgi:type I restriction enzyme S subunit
MAGSDRHRARQLGELCSLIVDSEHKTAPKDPDGLHPLVRTSNLKLGRADFDGAQRVNAETYALWTRRAAPRQGDLILAREAPVGGIGRVPAEVHPVLGQRTVLLRPSPEVVESKYLMYRLAAPDLQARMSEMATGATVPHLNMADIRAFRVPDLPDLGEQRRRSALLAAFDDLIEINERRIALLEGLARSLYREWFERFRFPGHGAGSVDGASPERIPYGWSLAALFEVADVGFGYSFKSPGFSESGSHAVVRIRDVPRGMTTTFTEESAPERYAIRDGDVLVGMDGEFHLNQWSGGDAWLNQRVARLRPKAGFSARHLMLALQSPIRELNGAISGTTVAHLGKRHLETIRIAVPPAGVLCAATQAFDAFADEVLALLRVNRKLAETRDLLLPRLVTGRLDISGVDLGPLLPAEDA